MSFLGQMVDRAYVRGLSSTVTTKIEGTKQRVSVDSEWFRCAFIPGVESEDQTDGGTAFRRRGSQLITGRCDESGGDVTIRARDTVFVKSEILGDMELQVVGQPQEIRRGRVRSGLIVEVRRVNPKGASS